MRRAIRLLLLTIVVSAAAVTDGAAAPPWAMIAHRVIGRVEQLSQRPRGEQAGFDVATVILNADAAKVYATAVAMLRRNQAVHVTAEDATNRNVQFSNGMRSAGITVASLGTRLSQILVASAVMPGQDPATERVIEGILRVCQEMKVTCSPR